MRSTGMPMERQRRRPDVVPANAGTHNHRSSKLQTAGAAPIQNGNGTEYGSPLSRGRPQLISVPSPRPDIEHVAIFRAEIVDPAQPRIRIDAFAFAIDRDQRCLDVRLHLSAVAADINDRAYLDQAPNAFLLRPDQILHIGLWALRARERGVQFGDATGCERFQFVSVEIILIGMPAAEEQQPRAERRALRFQRGALLQEAAEWRQSRSGANHDDGHGSVVGQPEAGLGLAHRGVDRLSGAAAGTVIRADAFVDAASRTRGGFDHADGGAAARGVAPR